MAYTGKRNTVVDAKPKVGAAQKARKASHDQTHADGTLRSSPRTHGKSDGGKGGMNGMKDVKNSTI